MYHYRRPREDEDEEGRQHVAQQVKTPAVEPSLPQAAVPPGDGDDAESRQQAKDKVREHQEEEEERRRRRKQEAEKAAADAAMRAKVAAEAKAEGDREAAAMEAARAAGRLEESEDDEPEAEGGHKRAMAGFAMIKFLLAVPGTFKKEGAMAQHAVADIVMA